MRPSHLVSSILLCSPLVAAWPWSDHVVAQARDLILPHKRAPQEVTLGSDSAATPRPEDVITTNTAVATRSSDSQESDGPSTLPSDDNTSTLESGSQSGSGTATRSGSSRTTGRSGSQTTRTFDARLPAGGIAMITPNPLSQSQYYKIGDFVTFAWNYTSLLATPSAIDVLASCPTNQATYTIAVNQTVAESTGAVTWDTGDYEKTATVALLTCTYTLLIYDSDSSVSAVAAAGYLAPYRQFTFGMYEAQPYVALEGQVCITCNGAGSMFERQTMGFAMLMAAITVVSFTCFARGAGILA